MPITKKQPIRIKVIDECLSIGGYWGKDQLLKEISKVDIDISDRTLEQDISDMKISSQLRYYAPIEFCRKNKGYHYKEPNFSIFKLPLNKSDVKALELAATTLDQYRYMPLMSEFTATIDKIIRVVNRVKIDNHATILEFIEFEKTPVALGLEYMDPLIDAIQNKVPLKLSYQKFHDQISETTVVHPYYLKEYRNRWYMIGFNSTRKGVRTYAFDRIKDLKPALQEFIPNSFIDSKKYLRNCIGINLRDGIPEKVRLQFTAHEGMYIKTQKLHHSQITLQDNEEAFVIELEVIINFELVGIILSYGALVKVLQPDHLAKKISLIALDIYKQYVD